MRSTGRISTTGNSELVLNLSASITVIRELSEAGNVIATNYGTNLDNSSDEANFSIFDDQNDEIATGELIDDGYDVYQTKTLILDYGESTSLTIKYKLK